MYNFLLQMDNQLRPHKETLLTIGIILLSVSMTIISYFLVRTINSIDNNFSDVNAKIRNERIEPIDEDEKIRLMIDNKIDRREFNIHMESINEIKEDMRIMRGDIKSLLQK
jgi:hypothetical protein